MAPHDVEKHGLLEEEGQMLREVDYVQHQSSSRRGLNAWSLFYILIAGCMSLSSFILGQRFPSSIVCAQRYSSWSPARQITRFEQRTIQGEFFAASEFRGQPSAELDQNWDDLWQIGAVPIRLQDSDLERLGKSPDRNWSRIPEEMGGGIRGYPNVFHQLHCLNTLRKVSYKEHYMNDKLFLDPAHVSRAHIDHCIEILRQQLMCSAEMIPNLTEEIEGRSMPKADFTTNQVCKNFDELRLWTEQNVIHGGGNWDIPSAHKDGAEE